MRRESFQVRALVVRSYDFGESDRIIVLLTRDHGLIRAVAKGVRRSRSRFGSRLEPFVELDVQLYAGRQLATITTADTVGFFAQGIVDDTDRYFAACALLEAAERLGGEAEIYDLCVAKLIALQTAELPTLVFDSFLLEAMKIAGWAPSLFACAQCEAPGPHHAFHPAPGGAVCHACRPSGSLNVHEDVLHIMWLLSEGHDSKALQLLNHRAAIAASIHQVATRHFHWHTERRLASLHVLEQAQ